MEAKLIFLEELIQIENINDGNYFKVSFKSRVNLNDKIFSFKLTDDSKYGSEIEIYEFEGDSPDYESELLRSYVDTVAPSPDDIIVDEIISFDYEENNGFIEILF